MFYYKNDINSNETLATIGINLNEVLCIIWNDFIAITKHPQKLTNYLCNLMYIIFIIYIISLFE